VDKDGCRNFALLTEVPRRIALLLHKVWSDIVFEVTYLSPEAPLAARCACRWVLGRLKTPSPAFTSFMTLWPRRRNAALREESCSERAEEVPIGSGRRPPLEQVPRNVSGPYVRAN
jgi:hypothetical protein